MTVLHDVKEALAVDRDDTTFDNDIMMHIASSVSVLGQLGTCDIDTEVTKDTEWDAIIPKGRYNLAKQFVITSVRLAFDPPNTGFVTTAMKEQRDELASRLVYAKEVDSV